MGLAALFAGVSIPAVLSAQSLEQDATAFATRPVAESAALSPDGTKMVFLVGRTGGSTSATVFDLTTGKTQPVLTSAGAEDALQWCNFAGNTVLVCKFGGNIKDSVGLIPYSRLVRLDIDGSNIKPLGQQASFYDDGLRQFDGSIIDWMPSGDSTVLMAKVFVPEAGRTGTRLVRQAKGLGVEMIDLKAMKTSKVESPATGVSGYETDGLGQIRLRYNSEVDSGGMLTGRTKIAFRKAGSRDWLPLGEMNDRDPASIEPLAIEAASDTLYFLRKLNGRKALYRMPLDGSMASTLVASHPSVDIDGISRVGRGQKVVGYTFALEGREVVYFDKEFDQLSKSLGKALAKTPVIDFVDASADGRKMIIFAGSDVDAGSYYYFNRDTKELSPLTEVRPALKGRTLSPVKPVRYKSRDGQDIPAYVTLPVGSTGKDLPAVILPHGGPSARDEWGFDWLAQFLVARGYAVIQPNYRGSAGYGDDFENVNGFRNWQTSINDINDAADYLVQQGIANRNRIAVVGWSYGGYAALQAAAVSPERYKASVAIAPVTDLALLKTEAADFTSGNLVKDFVGGGANARSGSPLRNAASIKAPVLLVHGDLDINVGVTHSERMESALRSGGTSVEFLRYPKLDHQLDDSAARMQMLTKIGQLLDRTIGRPRE